MNYIDYIHVYIMLLVSNKRNISKVKETQDKKLCNLLLSNMGKKSDICQDLDNVIINFSSYNLNDHEKSILCEGLNFAFTPKAIEYSIFLLSFEMLFRESSFKHVSKIFDKNLSREEVKALNNFVKNKELVIQKAGKGNSIVFLNRSDHISKLSKILEDISKFKRVNIDEGKALNHLIHMEERIISLLKSLEHEGEISEKGKNYYNHQIINWEFCMGMLKSTRH